MSAYDDDRDAWILHMSTYLRSSRRARRRDGWYCVALGCALLALAATVAWAAL